MSQPKNESLLLNISNPDGEESKDSLRKVSERGMKSEREIECVSEKLGELVNKSVRFRERKIMGECGKLSE